MTRRVVGLTTLIDGACISRARSQADARHLRSAGRNHGAYIASQLLGGPNKVQPLNIFRGMVVWMSSDASSYMTGADTVVE